ncbi:hypothetical protein NC651_023315 [Populus alba x Populus x berolinensis]|nr:hypothetical protein NC651_023315 [Populus alba x Populus x berolinensis]
MHMSKGFECGKHKMLNSNLKRMGSSPSSSSVVFAVLFLVLNAPVLCHGGKTSSFVRKVEKTVDMPLDSDVFRVPPSYNAPQQVHITQGDHVGKAVIVSWVTANEPGSKKVIYWSENSEHKEEANSKVYTYKFYNYTSGYIHHCTIRNLEFNTKYYYVVGVGHTERKFWFTTPPAVGPDVPYTFGLIGDLGQSYDSNTTLTHYEKNPTKGQAVLFVGDLSYADNYPNHDNVRWDTWGRFVERSVAYQPWIWTAGNHEIDFAPEIRVQKLLEKRIHSKRMYCFCRVKLNHSSLLLTATMSLIEHHKVLLLFGTQSRGLQPTSLSCLHTLRMVHTLLNTIGLKRSYQKFNRSETPWLIVLMHSPWYNSYKYHYMEGETMRVMYERWFVQYKVDVVFAGHVHAYERSERISNIAYNIVNGKCVPSYSDGLQSAGFCCLLVKFTATSVVMLQSLQALKKISQEHPTACLRAGALMAVLSYLDFFSTGVQRVSLSTAAKMCKKLPSDAADFVMEAVPLLTNLLQYHDAKVLEHASVCLTRIAEAFASSPDKLDELCNHGLVTQAASLISTSSSAVDRLLSALQHIRFLRLSIWQMSFFLRFHMELSLSQPALVCWSKGSVVKKSPSSSSGKQDDINGNVPEVSAREKLLNDQPELLQQFGMDLLPVLIQIYGSSVNSPVRHKCLSVIGKLMHFSNAEMIQSLLSMTNISSFLAGVLAWKDPHVLVPALQVAEILMEKLPGTFSKIFVREGVVYAVDQLILAGNPNTASTHGSSAEKDNESVPGTSSRSRRYKRRSGSSNPEANSSEESKNPIFCKCWLTSKFYRNPNGQFKFANGSQCMC